MIVLLRHSGLRMMVLFQTCIRRFQTEDLRVHIRGINSCYLHKNQRQLVCVCVHVGHQWAHAQARRLGSPRMLQLVRCTRQPHTQVKQ